MMDEISEVVGQNVCTEMGDADSQSPLEERPVNGLIDKPQQEDNHTVQASEEKEKHPANVPENLSSDKLIRSRQPQRHNYVHGSKTSVSLTMETLFYKSRT